MTELNPLEQMLLNMLSDVILKRLITQIVSRSWTSLWYQQILALDT
jgi:hypothetical protein